MRITPFALVLVALPFTQSLRAANEATYVEAESGTLGADLQAGTVGNIQYIEATVDNPQASPGAASRVASYSVTFTASGTYQLYARIFVGAGDANDDSFFYGNGFGAKTATDEADWITANQLATGVGFTNDDDEVSGGGVATSQVWKWIMLSSFNGGEEGVSFTVPANQLTQTFQIGTREDGLRIDRFAFGETNVYYTVKQLNDGLPGDTTTSETPYDPKGLPIAQGNPKWLGGVYSSDHAINFNHYWNQVVPENAGKWGSVEGTRDVMNWAGLDAAYALARDNGFPFRMHVLVWGNQQPSWIESLPPATQLEEIEEWIAAVAERYPDVDYLEVVNEFDNDPPDGPGDGNYIGALGGTGTTGYDWILTAFRLARKHFPNTPLMLNEYSVVNSPSRAQRYMDVVNLLKAENLIQVLGIQCHAFSTRSASATAMEANLDLLGSSGLPIWVTELDIDGLDDSTQLAEYQRVFPVLWEHPSVIGITLWGYRPQHWRAAQGAYLAYSNGSERRALKWLREYVVSEGPATFNRFLLDRELSHDVHLPDSDIDGDSLSAAFEYLLGTNPSIANAPPMTFTADNDLGRYHFPTPGENVEGYLVIERSANLVDWEDVATFDWKNGYAEPFELKEIGTGYEIVVTSPFPAESDRGFFRARFYLKAP